MLVCLSARDRQYKLVGFQCKPRRGIAVLLESASDIGLGNATAVLPLYRGEDMNGNDVYYVLTESNEVDESIRLGLNWTPKLVHAVGTRAVQSDTRAGGGGNPNNFPVVRFSGNVDFGPDDGV